MKKQNILKAILITSMGVIAATTTCISITACKTKKKEHQHTYSQQWNKDATNHWHDATCDHANEKSEAAAHDTAGTDGACSVCGYKPATSGHQHVYSNWVNTDPTEHYKTCTGENCTEPAGTRFEQGAHDNTNGNCVCGYHVHTLSDWAYTDATGHYKTCTSENCTEPAGTKYEKTTHDNTNGDCVCGYHAHTYATEWNYDMINHWHTATCGHDTEKGSVGTHNYNGANGACSVCGLNIYTTLAAKDGVLFAEDFETAQEKLPDFSGEYGTQGLYSYAGATAGHYVKVENGIAQMVKGGNGETSLLVDFGLTAGTVEGYLEATIGETTNNSWTFFRLVSAGGSEVFGLRSDNAGVKYRLDGGSVAGGNTSVAFSKTTYKIYFKLDGKMLTMTINGADFVKDVVLSTDVLGGIRFVSGNSHNGVVSVDNLVIVNDITFADLKTATTARLQAAYAAYDLEVAYATNGAQITAAKEAGEKAITAAETKEELLTAYNNAVTAMKAVKSDLTIYKDGKIEELEAYATGKGESNYSEAGWTAIQGKVEEGTASINKASDITAIDAALAEAKTAIDEVPDLAYETELNSRDDCEVTLSVPGTDTVLDFTKATKADNLKNFNNYTEFKDSFLGIGADTGRVQLKGYLDVYTGAKKGTVGGILTVTTTAPNASLLFNYNSVSNGRYFIIYGPDGNVYGDGDITGDTVSNPENFPAGAYAQKAVNGKAIILGDAGVYTLKFATIANDKAEEHKIDKISLTETKSETVTAKVNKVDATVVETATAGVAVANLVSKITVQLDYNGEMLTAEITEKDQYTVIVKDSEEAAVTTDKLAAGTYTVLVIFGSGREESAATKYNSASYTLTVDAASVTP